MKRTIPVMGYSPLAVSNTGMCVELDTTRHKIVLDVYESKALRKALKKAEKATARY